MNSLKMRRIPVAVLMSLVALAVMLMPGISQAADKATEIAKAKEQIKQLNGQIIALQVITIPGTRAGIAKTKAEIDKEESKTCPDLGRLIALNILKGALELALDGTDESGGGKAKGPERLGRHPQVFGRLSSHPGWADAMARLAYAETTDKQAGRGEQSLALFSFHARGNAPERASGSPFVAGTAGPPGQSSGAAHVTSRSLFFLPSGFDNGLDRLAGQRSFDHDCFPLDRDAQVLVHLGQDLARG